MAVPGPVDLPASRGVNELLRDGAGVATCASDVLSMLGEGPGAYEGSPRAAQPGSAGEPSVFAGTDDPILSGCAASTGETGEADRLLELLRLEPAHVDLLARRTGLAVSRTLALLGRLSLEGRVQAVGGGRYRAVS
jgi:DNA processing protein